MEPHPRHLDKLQLRKFIQQWYHMFHIRLEIVFFFTKNAWSRYYNSRRLGGLYIE